VVGHVLELGPVGQRHAAAGLLLVRKASISSEVLRILLRGLYSRLARGTWVEHTGLHLPQRRQSLMSWEISPMAVCSMISDSWPIRLKLGV
jgi:hypothetical protein